MGSRLGDWGVFWAVISLKSNAATLWIPRVRICIWINSSPFSLVINKKDLPLPVISIWWLLPGQLGNEERNRETSKKTRSPKWSYYINSNRNSGPAKGNVKMNLKRGATVLKYDGYRYAVPMFRPCESLMYQRVLVNASLGLRRQNDCL